MYFDQGKGLFNICGLKLLLSAVGQTLKYALNLILESGNRAIHSDQELVKLVIVQLGQKLPTREVRFLGPK